MTVTVLPVPTVFDEYAAVAAPMVSFVALPESAAATPTSVSDAVLETDAVVVPS